MCLGTVPPLVWKAFMDVIVKTLRDWAHGRIDAQGNPIQTAPATTSTALPPQQQQQQQAQPRTLVPARALSRDPSMSSLSSMTEINSVMVDVDDDDDVVSVADSDVVSVAVEPRRVIVID